MTETRVTAKTQLALMLIGARTRAGMSQDQLAERSGVSADDIASIEEGKIYEVSVDLLIDLLAATGTTLVARQDSASGPAPEETVSPEVTANQIDLDLREWKPGQRRAFLIHTPAELGHALTMARIRKGMTQERAAEGMGMRGPSVCKHETGYGSMNMDTLARYAAFYDVEFVVGAKRDSTP